MPDSAPFRLPPPEALDEGLSILFRTLAAQPAPAALVALADQLEAAGRAAVQGERRAFGAAT